MSVSSAGFLAAAAAAAAVRSASMRWRCRVSRNCRPASVSVRWASTRGDALYERVSLCGKLAEKLLGEDLSYN